MDDEKRDACQLTREVQLPYGWVDHYLVRKTAVRTQPQLIKWKRLPGRGWYRGVCAGLAYRFGVRPWKVRLLFVLLACTWLPAMYYLLAMKLVPARKRLPKDFDQRTEADAISESPA